MISEASALRSPASGPFAFVTSRLRLGPAGRKDAADFFQIDWRRLSRFTEGEVEFELSPFSGLPNKTSYRNAVKGGKLIRPTSGRFAP